MSRYGLLDPGTCIPVLECICSVYRIENAIEFGAGIWSTFSLTRNCKSVTSIEHNKDWVDVVKNDYSHKNNLNVVHWEKPMNKYLTQNDKTYDLIFIDGKDRPECLMDSFDRAPIIVCHDTHQDFNWHRVDVPNHYKQLHYTGCKPYVTTIFWNVGLDLQNQLLDKSNFNHTGTQLDVEYLNDDDIIAVYKKMNKKKKSKIVVPKLPKLPEIATTERHSQRTEGDINV
tara:strand:+ start:1465 stop:2148 length:684 start_codon:yes stop_codon:yes gene_type:complete